LCQFYRWRLFEVKLIVNAGLIFTSTITIRRIAMPNPMAGDDKPKSRTSKKSTVSKSAGDRPSPKSAAKKAPPAMSSEQAIGNDSPTQVIITEDEYRGLVAQKAHEIFLQRCAATEVDDWVQAERFVKETLLARGQTAGFV
jgi:hypothetical protein